MFGCIDGRLLSYICSTWHKFDRCRSQWARPHVTTPAGNPSIAFIKSTCIQGVPKFSNIFTMWYYYCFEYLFSKYKKKILILCIIFLKSWFFLWSLFQKFRVLKNTSTYYVRHISKCGSENVYRTKFFEFDNNSSISFLYFFFFKFLKLILG